MYTDEHLYSIALRSCNFIGNIHFAKLVDHLGSAKDVWQYCKKELQNINGIGSKIIQDIGNDDYLKIAEKEIEFCTQNKIKILLRQKGLPYVLNECDDAPAILYLKGNIDENLHPISVVGTRNITPYGKKFIHEFLAKLPSEKICTISGLALGVDKEVHQVSIEHTINTIGVLAHGFKTFYPSNNKILSHNILEKGGALLTEYMSTIKPNRENFLQRNRLIAGLSPSTVIVETAFSGGSLSTATFANQYNRDVYALPGKITDKYSQGCNALIQQCKASAIVSIPQLIDSLEIRKEHSTIGTLFSKDEVNLKIPTELQELYNLIKKHPNIGLDELSDALSMPTYQLMSKILELEIAGVIRTSSARKYVLL